MKKEQIIESARMLFTTYGYKKVSMDEIAEEAQVTKKTIYSYFKDKDELFKYFVLEEIGEMKKIIETNEQKQIPFFEQIHQTIYELLKYKRNAKFLVQLTKESENLKNGSVIESLKMLDDSIKQYIKEKLEDAILHNYIRQCNVEVASFLIYKMYIALMYEWKEEHGELNEEEVSDTIIEILKEGLFYQGGEDENGKHKEK